MNVKESNASPELQRVRQRQLWALLHLLLEVDSILAHDIIHHQSHRNLFHVICALCSGNASVLQTRLNYKSKM